MSVKKAVILFLCAAVVAWLAAYVPGMWHRHQVIDALDAPVGRWICVINGDAVSSEYEGYITRKYIMLGRTRYYSEAFRKWGRAADYMLVVITDDQDIDWVRLDLPETDTFARRYGITRAGCRRFEPGNAATATVAPITQPMHDGVYSGPVYAAPYGATASPSGAAPTPGSSFDWKRAVGPALEPAHGGTSAAPDDMPVAPATAPSAAPTAEPATADDEH